MNGRNLGFLIVPFNTSEAYLYCASNMPSRTYPFVVIQKSNGCFLAPIACFIKSYISLSLIAASSSMTAPCASRPSRLLVLLAKALMKPKFSAQYRSAALLRMNSRKVLSCMTILCAALKPSFACSSIVAML